MSSSQAPAVRPRPPLISALRILLPSVAGMIALAVVATAVTGGFRAAERRAAATRPIELLSPKMVGEDGKKRAFVITAARAERIEGSTKIRLENPVLLRQPGAPDQMRVTAKGGVYDQGAGRLELAGDVKLTGPSGDFATPAAVYDAKTGEVAGRGVQASGGVGQMQAGSFAVEDKGKSVTYKGGVHTRLNVK